MSEDEYKNKIIIVVKGGVVQEILCTDSAMTIKVIDLDDKDCGDNFIHEFIWPNTQWDDDRIIELSQRRVDDEQ